MSARVLRSSNLLALIIVILSIFSAQDTALAAGAPSVEGTLVQKSEIRLDFKDQNKHFFAMTLWEGPVDGSGPFAKAKVLYYGVQNVFPGSAGSQSGFITITKSDTDIAYLKWSTQSNFLTGTDGNPLIIDQGNWTFIQGIGAFKNLKGSGTMKLRIVKNDERTLILEGNLTK